MRKTQGKPRQAWGLADAALLFEDFFLIREDVTEGYAEQRFLAIGRADGRILMVVYTLPDEDTIRYYLGPAGRHTGTTKILP